uniref:Uncharacterized protein n=1 Tax=Oryza brachyantha TaxID=4533 RepID=J3N1M5_ORYBR
MRTLAAVHSGRRDLTSDDDGAQPMKRRKCSGVIPIVTMTVPGISDPTAKGPAADGGFSDSDVGGDDSCCGGKDDNGIVAEFGGLMTEITVEFVAKFCGSDCACEADRNGHGAARVRQQGMCQRCSEAQRRVFGKCGKHGKRGFRQVSKFQHAVSTLFPIKHKVQEKKNIRETKATMPTFGMILDLSRHHRIRRLCHLLRRRTRMCHDHPHRHVAPPTVPPATEPPTTETPRRIQVEGIWYCAHHGWTAWLSPAAQECFISTEMESPPTPFIVNLPSLTPPSPPPGFGQGSTIAECTGELPIEVPSSSHRHAGQAAARRPGLRATFRAVPHGSPIRRLANGNGVHTNGVRTRPVSDSDEEQEQLA